MNLRLRKYIPPPDIINQIRDHTASQQMIAGFSFELNDNAGLNDGEQTEWVRTTRRALECTPWLTNIAESSAPVMDRRGLGNLRVVGNNPRQSIDITAVIVVVFRHPGDRYVAPRAMRTFLLTVCTRYPSGVLCTSSPLCSMSVDLPKRRPKLWLAGATRDVFMLL